LDVLFSEFGFLPQEEDNQIKVIRAAGQSNDMNYYWYQVSYPNIEHPDLVFDYLYNETKKTGRIISIDLRNISTKRGITVGDTLEQLKQTYGSEFESIDNSETTKYIEFKQNTNTLTYVYEKNTGVIEKINIDYDSNKAMEEMDICGFGY
jgi:hypothetical protein